jgi:hypothetical protein
VGSNGTILHTEDGGSHWQAQSSGTNEALSSVSFTTPQSGWAVGSNGTILRTEDGGNHWQAQSSGMNEDLYYDPVSIATPRSGGAVGAKGTILQPEIGGVLWIPNLYRQRPAPWYYVAFLCCFVGLWWASLKLRPAMYIEDVANNNNPVTELAADRLGYRATVLRLARFIQNPNTAAPLVLSIQAPWGMGKSSVMRMLESELKHKRAAATVWFNAWHHQKEDQLLAYLLEAIQKRIAPSWFSAVGLGFRFNLLRVRMLSSVESFFATLAALAVLIFRSNLAAFISGKLERWVGHTPQMLSLVVVLGLGIGILMNQLRAFNADPQKLLQSSAKPVWRFLRDLFVFPSLQSRTDVRHEFEKNLQEVTSALRPQRLVIFLDDLDRCRPEQVVQILEAINFLSSAAPCFIVIGADYSKVETLVGMQFEGLAMQEEQNSGDKRPDPASTRLTYARNYMKKIVNVRLNLPRPAADVWRNFLGHQAEALSNTAMRWQQGVVAAVLLLCATVVLAQGMGWIWAPPFQPDLTVPLAKQAIAAEKQVIASEHLAIPSAPTQNSSAGVAQRQPQLLRTVQAAPIENRNLDGSLLNNVFSIGAASFMGLVFLVIVFRRPREPEKALDSKEFVEALHEERVIAAIRQRCDTPREMRRFLNYLRLVAAPDDLVNGEAAQFPEANLVRLAATGLQRPAGEATEQLFTERCEMFGLDPATFTPRDETGSVRNHAAPDTRKPNSIGRW